MQQPLAPQATRSVSAYFDFFLCPQFALWPPWRWAEMKKWLFSVAGLALAGSMAVHSQAPAVPPAKILDIETINIKPYQDGPFDRVASEYPGLSEKLKDP